MEVRPSASASRCFNDFPSVGPASQRSDVDGFFRSRKTRPINVICWRGKVTVSDGVCLGIDIHPPPYLHHHRDRRRTRSWQIGSAPSVAQINPCQREGERERERPAPLLHQFPLLDHLIEWRYRCRPPLPPSFLILTSPFLPSLFLILCFPNPPSPFSHNSRRNACPILRVLTNRCCPDRMHSASSGVTLVT